MTAATPADVRKAIGPGPRSRRWTFAVVTALAIALAAVIALRPLRGRLGAQGPAFESAAVTRGDVRVTVTATGTLQAVTTVEIGAEVTGRLLSVRVDANDVVKKGQVLAEIDPELLRAAVDEVSAQVAAADAAVRQARASKLEAAQALARARAQVAEGLASTRDLEAAIAAAARADASVESAVANATVARATLKSARSKLDKTTIVSSIDGIVLSRLVEPGQTVTAGFQTPVLFRLAQDLTRMRLNVDVDEADVSRVHEGANATFTVEAYGERSFPSQVTSFHNDPKTSQNVVTYQAVLAVDNAERRLRPGMTGTATITAETRHDVKIVPNAALRFAPPKKSGPGVAAAKTAGVEGEGGERQRVWILDARGALVAVPVRVGATDGTVTEIVSGALDPDAKVIVDVKEASP
jgi:HlyD family secretion protein